ncbi:MAG: Oligopeptide/dipeptide transporter, C-terminal region, partial [Gaiellales bacterium]|nr:Oligopeptide/dipeptide transporter, C-terminal region [Gaiellales bacterium]
DSVLVMDRGALCETGRVSDVLAAPTNEYTRRLLTAAPSLPDGALDERWR